MKATLLPLAAVMFTTPAVYADGNWLSTGGVSWHDRSGYNGRNGGLGIEYDLGNHSSLAIGAYQNSYNTRSRYVFGMKRVHLGPHLALGVAGGSVDGYAGIQAGGPGPAIVPLLIVETQRVGINALYIPPFGSARVNVIGVLFKFRIN